MLGTDCSLASRSSSRLSALRQLVLGDPSLCDRPAPHTSFTRTFIANFGSIRASGTQARSPSPTQACTDTCIICTQPHKHIYSEFGPGGFGCDCRLGLWRDLYGACRAHLWLLLSDGRQLAVCVSVCVVLWPGKGLGERKEPCVCLGHRATSE